MPTFAGAKGGLPFFGGITAAAAGGGAELLVGTIAVVLVTAPAGGSRGCICHWNFSIVDCKVNVSVSIRNNLQIQKSGTLLFSHYLAS